MGEDASNMAKDGGIDTGPNANATIPGWAPPWTDRDPITSGSNIVRELAELDTALRRSKTTTPP
jgi:hypothetical protein